MRYSENSAGSHTRPSAADIEYSTNSNPRELPSFSEIVGTAFSFSPELLEFRCAGLKIWRWREMNKKQGNPLSPPFHPARGPSHNSNHGSSSGSGPLVMYAMGQVKSIDQRSPDGAPRDRNRPGDGAGRVGNGRQEPKGPAGATPSRNQEAAGKVCDKPGHSDPFESAEGDAPPRHGVVVDHLGRLVRGALADDEIEGLVDSETSAGSQTRPSAADIECSANSNPRELPSFSEIVGTAFSFSPSCSGEDRCSGDPRRRVTGILTLHSSVSPRMRSRGLH